MTRLKLSFFMTSSGIQTSTGFPAGPGNDRVIPPRSFWTRRSCIRVVSTIGDGFCDAAGGGVAWASAADVPTNRASTTVDFRERTMPQSYRLRYRGASQREMAAPDLPYADIV